MTLHSPLSCAVGLLLLLAVLPGRAQAPDEETSMARFQSTYVWQHKPSFAARYSGDNSLSPRAERSYTFTLDAYLGLRPWQGGEVYLVPEVTQGVPLSGLTGLGGFTNGEASRVTGSHPTLYRQKLFLRQTWAQDGGRQKVEAEVDQMAGETSRDRLVLTAGNLSVLDVFDDNAYAKDPRSQFMNWSGMTYAAYDYPADARGFSWGAALEWYRGDWALRGGRFIGPETPNGQRLDWRIGRRFGDQVEIEHAHSLAGQPGKVRALAWRSRALVADFDEARAYGLAHPTDPDRQWIRQVRNGVRTKYGVGVNLEQALAADAGVFLRAMRADGHTETFAFSEADRSLAAGLTLQGTRWGRGEDAAGLMVARNGISPQRRAYLAAGGLSFFIGDGALRYAPETIVEAFYRYQVSRALAVSLDWQRIANPAYNADRGPVNVGSVRLHAEF